MLLHVLLALLILPPLLEPLLDQLPKRLRACAMPTIMEMLVPAMTLHVLHARRVSVSVLPKQLQILPLSLLLASAQSTAMESQILIIAKDAQLALLEVPLTLHPLSLLTAPVQSTPTVAQLTA